MKHPAVAPLLLVPFVRTACGGSEPPTQPSLRTFTFESIREGPLDAHRSFCVDFSPDASGPAYAHAGFTGPIELGAGTCAGTRNVVARSETGEVTATLAAGDNFVRMENPNDSGTRFRLVLRYLILR